MIYVFDKKTRNILIIITLVALLSFSIGYASLNQSLNIFGNVSVLPSTEGTIVSNIGNANLLNNASETANSSKSGSSASLYISLPKVNSQVSYDITIRNNGSVSSRFSSASVTLSNDAITYVITGIDTSTIINSGEEVTCTITLYYNDEHKYELPSNTSASVVVDFEFVSTTRANFVNLNGSITPASGNVFDTEYGAMFNLTITNPNDFPVTYTLEGDNGFVVYNEEGKITTYYLGSNATDTFNIYVNDTDSSIASSSNAFVGIIAKVTDYDEEISNTLGVVNLTLEDKAKYVVLENSDTISDANEENFDYSSVDTSSSGIYTTSDIDGNNTYFYRGVVNNNYFSFAGYIWRILRIDSNSNMRLILNGFITNSSNSVVTKQYKSSNTTSSLDGANTLLRMVNDINDSSQNALVYGYLNSTDATTLRGWYNANLSSYERYIVDSKFCFDTSGGHNTSSGTNTRVYYYGSYQRIGQDSALYTPELNCSVDDIFIDKIGLLSSDEYVFAGGAFRTSNTTMFLNDFSSSYAWWTLSPAYYDSNLTTVGLFIVESNGSITDWPNGNTIKNSYAIRPVITVNGNELISGTGTKDDPYYFSS